MDSICTLGRRLGGLRESAGADVEPRSRTDAHRAAIVDRNLLWTEGAVDRGTGPSINAALRMRWPRRRTVRMAPARCSRCNAAKKLVSRSRRRIRATRRASLPAALQFRAVLARVQTLRVAPA